MDIRDSYLSALGRSLGPPSDREIAARRRALSSYLRPVLPRMHRGPACDLGCGRGEVLLALSGLGFSPVGGCDIGLEQVTAARQAGLCVEQADARQFLMGQGAQALITAFDVIEHLDRREGEALLSLIHERLLPGGWLVLQFPNGQSPWFGKVQYGDPTHVTVYGPAQVAALLRRLGFGSIQALETGPVAHGVVGRARGALWRGLRLGLRLIDAVETGALDNGPYTRVCLVVAQRGA